MGTGEQPNLAQKLLSHSLWGNSTAPFPCGPSLPEPNPQFLLSPDPASPTTTKAAYDTPSPTPTPLVQPCLLLSGLPPQPCFTPESLLSHQRGPGPVCPQPTQNPPLAPQYQK